MIELDTGKIATDEIDIETIGEKLLAFDLGALVRFGLTIASGAVFCSLVIINTIQCVYWPIYYSSSFVSPSAAARSNRMR